MQPIVDSSALSKVEQYLEKAVKEEPTISSVAVMTAEGFPLAILMGKEEAEKLELSAALASLGSLSEQTANKLGIGQYKDMILRSSRGHLLITRIGDGNILAVLTRKGTQLGACYVVVDALAKRLRRMLK